MGRGQSGDGPLEHRAAERVADHEVEPGGQGLDEVVGERVDAVVVGTVAGAVPAQVDAS